MSSNPHKILFLGVMLVIAVLGAQKTAPKTGNILMADVSAVKKINNMPVYALESAPQIIKNNEQASPSNLGPDAVTTEYNSAMKKFLGDELQPSTSTSADLADNGDSKEAAAIDSSGAYLESSTGPAWPTLSRLQSEPPPAIGATAAIIADLRNNTTFFDLKSDARRPLASVTKLMTAAIVSQNFPLNQSSTLKTEDFPVESAGGDIKIGERYTISDLRSAMLIESSNEAAMALANFYGYDKFMALMNDKAKEWGLNNTHFDDPVGLSSASQSTAADLLSLAKRIYDEQPEIFKITKKQSAYITELSSKKRILIRAINNFSGRADFLGGKTGYTDEASGNLLSIFSYKKQPILIVVLGTEDRFGDTEKLLNWLEANYN